MFSRISTATAIISALAISGETIVDGNDDLAVDQDTIVHVNDDNLVKVWQLQK